MNIDENSDECLLPEATTFDGIRNSSGDGDSVDEPISRSTSSPVARTLPAGVDGLSPNSALDDRLTAEYRGSDDATQTGELYLGDRTPLADPDAGFYTLDIELFGKPYDFPVLGVLDLGFAAVNRYEAPEGAQDVVDSLEDSFREVVQPNTPVSGSYLSSLPVLLTRLISGPNKRDDPEVEIAPSSPATALELRIDAGSSGRYELRPTSPS
jgi:hypothetical protein